MVARNQRRRNFTSWNQLDKWLRQVEDLRRVTRHRGVTVKFRRRYAKIS